MRRRTIVIMLMISAFVAIAAVGISHLRNAAAVARLAETSYVSSKWKFSAPFLEFIDKHTLSGTAVSHILPGKTAFVSLTGASIADQVIDTLLTFPELSGLILRNTSITIDGFRRLRELRVENLTLTGDQIDDKWMLEISNHKELKGIALSETSISDAGLNELTCLDLEFLHLYGDLFTEMAVQNIGPLGNIQSLRLLAMPVRGKYLAELNSIEVIEYLALTNSTLDDEVFSALAQMTKLQDLALEGTSVSDGNLLQLTQLPMLNTVNLSRTGVSGTGIRHLLQCSHLESVVLDQCVIGDDDIEPLRLHESLVSVSIKGTNVTSRGINELCKSPTIEFVFYSSANVDDFQLTSPAKCIKID